MLTVVDELLNKSQNTDVAPDMIVNIASSHGRFAVSSALRDDLKTNCKQRTAKSSGSRLFYSLSPRLSHSMKICAVANERSGLFDAS